MGVGVGDQGHGWAEKWASASGWVGGRVWELGAGVGVELSAPTKIHAFLEHRKQQQGLSVVPSKYNSYSEPDLSIPLKKQE